MAQVEGEHMLFNALLALWLIVLGDDAYDSPCYDMVMSCSDDSWGYIVDI